MLNIISIVIAIASLGIAYLTLRRTPKPSEPPITPTSTTILGANMERHIDHLPTYSLGMSRMGLGRLSRDRRSQQAL